MTLGRVGFVSALDDPKNEGFWNLLELAVVMES
jgi:hypothetical protein